MTTEIVTYECPIAGNEHTIPGPDTRVLKIGDGGFVIACDCGPEPLAEADSKPHPTVDHLVNVYAGDPSPEQWVSLESLADDWLDTTRWHSPDGYEGTNGQRRADFREKVKEIADEPDGRDLEPSSEEKRARKNVDCPYCGAKAGRKCQRPSGHRIRTPHSDRVAQIQEAAEPEGTTLSEWTAEEANP
jgi:hypothetical protein